MRWAIRIINAISQMYGVRVILFFVVNTRWCTIPSSTSRSGHTATCLGEVTTTGSSP